MPSLLAELSRLLVPRQSQLMPKVASTFGAYVFKSEPKLLVELNVFAAIGTEDSIPEREDVAKVAVRLDLNGGMVQAVQAGRDEQRTRVPFGCVRKTDVRMK